MSAADVLNNLDRQPKDALTWIDEELAFFVTPVFKRFFHIESWNDTGYIADGRGRPVRDAQYSTDGFWTVDTQIEFIRIEGNVRWSRNPLLYYIRLEVEPGTWAHQSVRGQGGIRKNEYIAFQGPVLWDHNMSFLEVHPRYLWFLD